MVKPASSAGRGRAVEPEKATPRKKAEGQVSKTGAPAKSGRAAVAKKVQRPKTLSASDVEAIYARFAEKAPHPQTELAHINPFTLLVAVVLSAQATDAGVNKATEKLFKSVNTPEAMVALSEEALRDAIKTIGLFNTKAKNIIALSRILVEQYGGVVPADRETLEKLPGVGRKSANVVLNVAFGQPTIAVDTHIFRVANRTGLAPGKTPLEVELGLERVTPAKYLHNAHHWLILHGRYVCKARKPECWRCLIADLCLFEPKTPNPAVTGKSENEA
jgi:endonuclease-3